MGYFWWLYYRVEKKFLWFKWHKWYLVPKPYWDKIRGSMDLMGWDSYVTTASVSVRYLDSFKASYPKIEDYFNDYYWPEMQRLKDKAREYWDEINQKRGETKAL